jgi:hypothetical protein
VQIHNNVRQDNLRLEIATLLEDITGADVRNPCKGKFKVNIAMPDASDATLPLRNDNLSNSDSSNGMFRPTTLTSTEYIELVIPEYIKVCMTGDIATIPAGTKFVVGYVGANNNDCKIVGIYGKESFSGILYTFYEQQLKLKQLTKRVIKLEKLHNIIYKGPLIGGETVDGM